MIFRITIGIICVIACVFAWMGIFKLIDAGYGWHMVVVVCGIALLLLLNDKHLVMDAPDDD